VNLAPLRALLKERDYVIYIGGTAASLTAQWVQRIAMAWLVWEHTHSPLWVGIASAADTLPTVIAALFGGVLADRWNRPRFIALVQLACALFTVVLAVTQYFGLLTLTLLIVLRVCLSASVAIVQPARMVLIAELVGLSNVTAAVSVGAIVFNLARALGPALAGALIAFSGFAVAFAFNAACYLAMALAATLIAQHPRAALVSAAPGALVEQMAEGCRYVLARFGVRSLFTLLLVFVLTARAVEDMLPAFVAQVLEGGVRGVATLTALLGVGSIAGALWASGRPLHGLTRAMLIVALGYAVSFGAFAVSTSMPLACMWMVVIGFCTVQFGTAAQALLQSSVASALRGRVMSLWFIVLRAGPGLGALLLGATSEVLGLPLALLAASIVCVIACVSMWPRLARMARELERPASCSTAA
jgi:MFS family permease